MVSFKFCDKQKSPNGQIKITAKYSGYTVYTNELLSIGYT